MKRILLITMASVAAMMTAAVAQSARGTIVQGNKLYAEQKYDEALTKYRDAEVQAPESPIIKFNISAAEYKKKNYEEALKQNQAALNQEQTLDQAKAYYNMGNTLFRMNKWPESVLAYKRSLELNPNDEDAKYNLEYVRKMMKDQSSQQNQNQQNQQQQNQQQQQQQQQQQNQQQDQQKQDQQQQQQQDQQQQKEENKDQQQQQDKQNQDQQQQQEQEQQQAQQQPKSQDDMSKEDAARILEAMKENPQNLTDSRKMKMAGSRRVLKDW
jgi:Ca-activated chloride channel homolog